MGKRGRPPLSAVRDSDGNKRCSMCGGWKPLSEFYAATKTADLLQSHCKWCKSLTMRCRNYGLSLADLNALFEAQAGRCSICEKDLIDARFHVDHDHSCCAGKTSCGKCVRGILCHQCNVAIGLLGEDVGILTAAISYLTKY